MKSGGSILRGQLRPSSGRSPPFLVVCLLIVTGFLAFNYWNLSTEYNDILREYADLQDHMRISILKRENAERQKEALERRLKESDSLVQKSKFVNEQKNYELRKVNEQLRNEKKDVASELTLCKSINNQLNSTNDDLKMIQKKTQELHTEQQHLKDENNKLATENEELRSEISVLKLKLSRYEARPPLIKVPDDFKEGHKNATKPVTEISSDLDQNNKEQEAMTDTGKAVNIEMNSDITQKSLNNENNNINHQQLLDPKQVPQDNSPSNRNVNEENVIAEKQEIGNQKQPKSETGENLVIKNDGLIGQEKPTLQKGFPQNQNIEQSKPQQHNIEQSKPQQEDLEQSKLQQLNIEESKPEKQNKEESKPKLQNQPLPDQQKIELPNKEDNQKQEKVNVPQVIEENINYHNEIIKDNYIKGKFLDSVSTQNPEKSAYSSSPANKAENEVVIQDKGNYRKNGGDNLENLMQPGVPEVEIPASNKSNDFDNERKEIISLMKPELTDNRIRNYSNLVQKDSDIILGIEMPEGVSTTPRNDVEEAKFLKPNSSAIAFESNENLENINKEEFNSSNINFNYNVKE